MKLSEFDIVKLVKIVKFGQNCDNLPKLLKSLKIANLCKVWFRLYGIEAVSKVGIPIELL